MDIDRQRIGRARAPGAGLHLPGLRVAAADRRAAAPHSRGRRHAWCAAGCTEGSDKEAELKTIVDLIESYEAKRWTLGKDPNVRGGKG
jgi:hypothetical protein